MKETKIAYALIVITAMLAIANIAGWIDISWWIVVAPVLSPFAAIIAIALLFCGAMAIGLLVTSLRDLFKFIRRHANLNNT